MDDRHIGANESADEFIRCDKVLESEGERAPIRKQFERALGLG
jgi:hypothetical protein